MKPKRTVIALLAAITMLSSCSGGQTASAPETETASAAETTTAAVTTTAATTKAATTTAATTTAAPVTTTAQQNNDEEKLAEQSKAYSEAFYNATFQEVYEYLNQTEHIPASKIKYVPTPDEDIKNMEEWIVKKVEINPEKVRVFVSKLSKSAYLELKLKGMRYDQAYDLLLENGATKKTITEKDDSLLGVWKKSNWSVKDCSVSEKNGVIYATLELSHDVSVGGILSGAIFKSVVEQKLDNYAEEHPYIGGALKGVFDVLTDDKATD